MTFALIWEELEKATPPGKSGRVTRRVRPDAKCDLFLAITKPSNLRMVFMLVDEASLGSVEDLPTSRGVEARIQRAGDDQAHAAVELILKDPRCEDIFTALATDIADSVEAQPDEPAAVTALVGRLRRWQHFLEESGAEGLTSERQRGLYSELWFLREHLLESVGPEDAVQSWTGPSRASHDFQLGAYAFEVKGTAAKQHQTLRVVSERQLDDTGVEVLYLFHLSLDAHRGAGESLPAIVDSLRDSLSNSSVATLFDDRLLEAGFVDAHRDSYRDPGYTKREANFFRVDKGFPRIVEADLLPGVGDVHYSVSVSECKHFLVDGEKVISELRSGHVS